MPNQKTENTEFNAILYDRRTKREILCRSEEYCTESCIKDVPADVRELFYKVDGIIRDEKICLVRPVDPPKPLGTHLTDCVFPLGDSLRSLFTQRGFGTGMVKEKVVKSKDTANQIHALQRYAEMCAEDATLLTLPSLQRICTAVGIETCVPQLLGLFIEVESKNGSYWIGDALDELNGKTINGDTFNFWGNHPRKQSSRPEVEIYRLPGDVVEKNMSVAVITLFLVIQEHLTIAKCKNCGKLFVPLKRSDTVYCDRKAPQDSSMTCKQYGTRKLWYDNLNQDEAAKLARNIYAAKQVLAKRNPENVQYRAMFEFFKQERKKWQLALEAGKKSQEEYLAWLKIMQAHKTLEPMPGLPPLPPALPED